MRRSQTVRHHIGRPSLALASDDLGLLREGDETNEDLLRKQLIERDRECERLNNENMALRQELRLRPAAEEFQEYQREKKNLEIILQGTQRENERSLNDINRMKERCALLERELCKLVGENWQTTLEIPPGPLTAGPMTGGRPSGFHGHSRSNTISSPIHPSQLPLSASPIIPARTASPRPSIASFRETKDREGKASRSSSPVPFTPSQSQSQSQLESQAQAEQERLATLARVEELRMLILGMEQRFSTREEKVEKLVSQATKEGERCERIAAKLVEA